MGTGRGSGLVGFAVFFVSIIELLRRDARIQTPLHDNRIVAAADREQLVAVRRVHRVNHDFVRCAVGIRDRQGLLVIECRVTLVTVKLCFVMIGDRPDQPFNGCALFGQNRQKAAPECQLIAVQLSGADCRCLRAAVGHLFKIQIGTVGKIFFSRHFFSYLASPVRGRG